jgi:hypothetical protein
MIRGGEFYMEMCRRWAADGAPITVEENLRLCAMVQKAGRTACWTRRQRRADASVLFCP